MNKVFILTVIFVKKYMLTTATFHPDEIVPLGEPNIGPKGIPYNKTTSCAEFGKFARFNPYSVIDYKWFVFYYWAPPKPAMSYVFKALTTSEFKYLQQMMKHRVADNFNWKAPMILMIDLEDKSTSLLVEVGDRGQYDAYIFTGLKPMGELIKPYRIRIKQFGDNKYLGFMICKDRTAYILSKIKDVPKKESLQDEAAKLGYRGRKGKSYLYQGHEWMPINEANEHEYWHNYKYERSSHLDKNM